ncbi:response regulator [Bacillus sp. 3255]|uniref:hybrid sensor histidine kinase/response regulator n=1 Tax=Bacillus sp. 3255 TaxID=2817904 RepID=UPI0028605208|nr:response regulator [Bacillus sp. 3255]MDR6881507.1 signal transduction histidine kinase/CheY-like chemotaxis protein/HPt (histidine-containing phosphotransfer) domain-containing protein [Bacillus sp. 3255]
MIKDLLNNFALLAVFTFISIQTFYNPACRAIGKWKFRFYVGLAHGMYGVLLALIGVQAGARHILDLKAIAILMATFIGGSFSGLIATLVMILGRTMIDPFVLFRVSVLGLLIFAGSALVHHYVHRYWSKWGLLIACPVVFLFIDMVIVYRLPFVEMVLPALLLHLGGGALVGALFQYFMKSEELRGQLHHIKQELASILRRQPGITFKVIRIQNEPVFTMIDGQLLHDLGLEPRRLVYRDVLPLKHFTAEFSEHLKLKFEEAWQGHQVSYEAHLQGRTLFTTLQPVFDGEQVAEIIGSTTDITERIEAEKRVQQSDQASQAKSQFIAKMSHEIRTPLNGIIGLTRILAKTPLSDHQKDYLSKIKSSSHTLLGIINDVLDLSKVEAGKLEVELTGFHIDELLKDLASILSVLPDNKPIELIFNTAAELPTHILGDPLRLKQVLLNLCSNAIKFTTTGYVMLKIEVEPSSSSSEHIMLHFTIEDSGIGISDDRLAAIFEPFSQADGSTSREYGGTGLGLTISQHLISLMGGVLEAASTVGKGSTFRFSLPFQVIEAADPDAWDVSKQHAPYRVLLVQDHPLMSGALRESLESFALIVTDVSSWKAMFDRLKGEEKYDAILLDMEAEDMYGIETWNSLMDTISREHTVVVGCTSPLGKEEMLKLPADQRPDAVLVKPICRLELFQTLDALFHPHPAAKHAGNGDAAKGLETKKTGRILLVEDNEINRQVAGELLEEQGYSVSMAENGQEAIDELQANAYDLVLMDIHMPVMDGMEAMQRIRQFPLFQQLPIVALTANVVKEDHEQYLRQGMNDVISKPLDVKRLYQVVSKWIEPRREQAHADASPPSSANFYMDIEAIDWRAALARVEGKASILTVMLHLFKKNYSGFAEQLIAHLREGDTVSAKRAVHTLLGVAGSLSADGLREATARLELAIAESTDLHVPLAAVAAEIERIIAGIPDEK